MDSPTTKLIQILHRIVVQQDCMDSPTTKSWNFFGVSNCSPCWD